LRKANLLLSRKKEPKLGKRQSTLFWELEKDNLSNGMMDLLLQLKITAKTLGLKEL
jgi:hypothetical protein